MRCNNKANVSIEHLAFDFWWWANGLSGTGSSAKIKEHGSSAGDQRKQWSQTQSKVFFQTHSGQVTGPIHYGQPTLPWDSCPQDCQVQQQILSSPCLPLSHLEVALYEASVCFFFLKHVAYIHGFSQTHIHIRMFLFNQSWITTSLQVWN